MDDFTQSSDSELLFLLKKSNTNAFTEVYNRYWDKLYIVAGNKLDDVYLAEEIVQDLFLDIWNRRETLRLSDHIGRYLAAALKYKIINIRHRRQVEQRYRADSKRFVEQQHYLMENYLQFDELKDRLDKLVAQLPEKCRLIYKLSREEGLPQKRIAEILGIAEKTVEAHLTRALKVIRSKIRTFSKNLVKKNVLSMRRHFKVRHT